MPTHKTLAMADRAPPNPIMTKAPSLDTAYALTTPEDSVKLYSAWADTYDSDFAVYSDYILHEHVARHFVNHGGFAPVLDVGAGTGLCGAALRARGIDMVDGTDISPEMLEIAREKGMYRTTRVENILNGLRAPDGLYQGAVSSGTFTNGHVGPDGLDAMLAVVKQGGWIVVSVNAKHFTTAGFQAKLTALERRIADASMTEVPIYGDAAKGPHAQDKAILLAFRRA